MINRIKLLLLTSVALLLSACAGVLPNEYVLTPQQLNKQFDRFFPLSRNLGNGMFRTSLAAPEFGAVQGQGRLSMASSFTVLMVFGMELNGKVALSSGLRYDASQHAIYLQDLSVDSLHINQDKTNLALQLSPLLNAMLGEYVKQNPLYRFGQDELRLGPIPAEISSMEIQDGGIRLKLKPR